jgi:DNA-binding NarL/FixJ family response regulator
MSRDFALIVEDHPPMAQAVADLLSQALPGSAPVIRGTVQGANAWLNACPAPRLMIVDPTLPDSQGLRTLERLARRRAGVPIIVFGAAIDDAMRRWARCRPLTACLSKLEARHALIATVTELLARSGGEFGPPAAESATAGDPAASALTEQLTPAQRDILSLLAHNHRDAEIAAIAGISLATVKSHMSNLRKRMGASNRAELLAIYLRIIGPNPDPSTG